MIGFFPAIYEDELLYSQLCRYYQRTGYTKYLFAVDDLFMRRTVHPCIEWVNEYTPDAMANITRDTDFETVIREHTMFPAYTRFLPQKRRAAALQSLLICDGNYYNLIAAQKSKQQRFLRYCPACAGEDRRKHGETYWYREHQILHINVCPKHRCYLKDSSVPIAGKATPGLFAAEVEVPLDTTPEPCANEGLIDFTRYVLEVFRSPVDMDSDVPIGSFLRSALDEKYRPGVKMQVHSSLLYEDYCAFFRDISEPMEFEAFRKVYNNYSLDHYRICQLAYFQRIPVERLVKPPASAAATMMEELYRELSTKYGIEYDTICSIGEIIIKNYRNAGRISRKSGPKQREWAELDEKYLPQVREIVGRIYVAAGKPGRVSVTRVERELGLPQKQLQKLPKCQAYIQKYLETQNEYRARQVTWAVRLFVQEGRYLSLSKLNHFLSDRKNDIAACFSLVTDQTVKTVVGELLAERDGIMEVQENTEIRRKYDGR